MGSRPGPEISPRAAPGHAHVTGDGGALVLAVDDEIVPLRLAADGLVDRGMEEGVTLGGA